MVASRVKDMDRDAAHTYVLFRDCGMLVMLRKFPSYAEIIDQTATIRGAQLTRIEDVRFKFNHARVASALARRPRTDSACSMPAAFFARP
jgi:HD-like signal output (HDOD) protein